MKRRECARKRGKALKREHARKILFLLLFIAQNDIKLNGGKQLWKRELKFLKPLHITVKYE